MKRLRRPKRPAREVPALSDPHVPPAAPHEHSPPHAANELFLIVDAESRVRHVSPAASSLLSDRLSRLSACHILSFVHRQDAHGVRYGLERLASGAEDYVTWISRLLTSRGTWRWFRVTAARNRPDSHRATIAMHLEDLTGRPLPVS